ncbi:MAG: helix-turn-helix domain-containing protein [Gammaproteobacteria bacterium]|nr:helix-turn-helix domain-containing protein [Gammaproteobacteria bacterium]
MGKLPGEWDTVSRKGSELESADLLEEAIPLIAQDIRSARTSLGITSARAAKRAGLSQSRYRDLEAGRMPRSKRTAKNNAGGGSASWAGVGPDVLCGIRRPVHAGERCAERTVYGPYRRVGLVSLGSKGTGPFRQPPSRAGVPGARGRYTGR